MSVCIVPCHGIWQGEGYGLRAHEWLLAPFQREGRDHLCFVHHILQGIHHRGITVFSGGRTKHESHESEGALYHALARRLVAAGIYDAWVADGAGEVTPEVARRWEETVRPPQTTPISQTAPATPTPATMVEEPHARDSFENVLFSLVQAHMASGEFPTDMSIVGLAFKEHRFVQLHLEALQWKGSVRYYGNAPFPPTPRRQAYFAELAAAEERMAAQPFRSDPYGLRLSLADKKRSRNPFNDTSPYAATMAAYPGLSRLLACLDSGTVLPPDPITFPWTLPVVSDATP